MGCLIGFLILVAGALLTPVMPALLPFAVIFTLVVWGYWLASLCRNATQNTQVSVHPVYPPPSKPASRSERIRPSGKIPGSSLTARPHSVSGMPAHPTRIPSGASSSASPQIPTTAQASVGRTSPGAFLISESDGARYPIPVRTLTLGRSAENNLVFVNDQDVSRWHAKLVFTGQRLMLADLGSTNGTMVNGKRIVPQTTVVLNDGDHIAFGHQRLRVELPRAHVTQPIQTPARVAEHPAPATPTRAVEPPTPATPTRAAKQPTPITPTRTVEPPTPAPPARAAEPPTLTTPARAVEPPTLATPARAAEPSTPAIPTRAAEPLTPTVAARDTAAAVPVPLHISPIPQPIIPPSVPEAASSAPMITVPEPIPLPQDKLPTVQGMRWFGANECLKVGAYTIEAPLTYVASITRDELDASCINLRLPVGRPVQQAKGALGYWPQYSRISPDQRANYLTWMASGRKAPLADIGYGFLFFYGLERRALAEGQDIATILAETNRLLRLYPESASFRGYLGSFVAYVLARAGIERLTESDFERLLLSVPGILCDSSLAVALAWLQHHNRPLPFSLAMEIAQHDIRSPHSVVTERLPEQFRALFAAKYFARYGDGMMLKAAARPLHLTHHPASPSLLTMRSYRATLDPAVIPNIMGLQSQFQPLVSLWSECIEELRPLSRQAAMGMVPHTREAYRALPTALKEGADHPDKVRWNSLVADNVGEDGRVLVPVSTAAPLIDVPKHPKLTLHQSMDLADTAHEVGFLIVPDPHITGRAYAWDDQICLFRPAGALVLPATGSYRPAASILELGMAMAAADGQVDDAEIAHVTRFLEDHFTLTEDERQYLLAYQAILQRQPPSLARVSKRLQGALSAEQRTLVGRFLVGVAATNGVVEHQETTALRAAYKALGIDAGELETLLMELQSGSAAPVPAETSVVLNTDLLEQILAETEEVSRLLGQASEGEESEGWSQPASDVLPTNPLPSEETSTSACSQEPNLALDEQSALAPMGVPSEAILALDVRYHTLLADLLTRDAWEKEAFDALMCRYGIMPAAVLEEINAWSDEYLGDFLIEEGDTYSIRRELLENKP